MRYTPKGAEEEDDAETPGKWIWDKKCGQQALGTVGLQQENIRQSRIESSGLWTMIHWERQGINHVKSIKLSIWVVKNIIIFMTTQMESFIDFIWFIPWRSQWIIVHKPLDSILRLTRTKTDPGRRPGTSSPGSYLGFVPWSVHWGLRDPDNKTATTNPPTIKPRSDIPLSTNPAVALL